MLSTVADCAVFLSFSLSIVEVPKLYDYSFLHVLLLSQAVPVCDNQIRVLVEEILILFPKVGVPEVNQLSKPQV